MGGRGAFALGNFCLGLGFGGWYRGLGLEGCCLIDNTANNFKIIR